MINYKNIVQIIEEIVFYAPRPFNSRPSEGNRNFGRLTIWSQREPSMG
jgi:hypothetical protein